MGRGVCNVKTIIELYDENPIHNVLATDVFRPEHTVFVGQGAASRRFRDAVAEFFRLRGIGTEPHFIDCGGAPVDIAYILAEVCSVYPDCAVEVTGGSDVALIAVGRMSAIRELPLFTYDMAAGRFRNLHACPEAEGVPNDRGFKAAELIAAAGGKMTASGRISRSDATPELEKDVQNIWRIFCEFRNEWSGISSWFQTLRSGGLKVSAQLKVRKGRNLVSIPRAVLRKLFGAGIIKNLKIQRNNVSFEFRNAMLGRCLRDAGIWLELRVFFAALRSESFDDVQISALINWDPGSEKAVSNEVDVIVTRGITALFISCKKAIPSPPMLAEISALTARFGGGFARAAVATMSDVAREAPYIALRAAESGIGLLTYEELSSANLEDIISALLN